MPEVTAQVLPVPNGTTPDRKKTDIILSCRKCTHGNKVTVEFFDAKFVFHAQWLHDARCDSGAARNATTAICQQPISTSVHVEKVHLSGHGNDMKLSVTWDDGQASNIPGPWLRVMAPLVAKGMGELPQALVAKGWVADTLEIAEISYNDIVRASPTHDEYSESIAMGVLDKLLNPSLPGFVKVVDLPEPNFEDERNHRNNIVTSVLKSLFGSVFIHPIRGSDQTFNVSSHNDTKRAVGVANYDTTQLLLPHSDHAFYDTPIQIQGFYGLEGLSENTWVSIPAALSTFRTEYPDLYHHLHETPMTFGRVLHFYGDPLYQATVDTPITKYPNGEFKRGRWHPNLTGSLLAPYDNYKNARLALQRFQEILRRDSHQLKRNLNAGDLYLWDNFRLLHGRERVLETPRTGVGQTVPEQVVHDRWRALHVNVLKEFVDEGWLVHMPMMQLREMLRLVKGHYWIDG